MSMIKDDIIKPHDPDFDSKHRAQMEQLCVCGHKLSMHGFVRHGGFSYSYISVSQCISFCGCQEFDPVNKDILLCQ